MVDARNIHERMGVVVVTHNNAHTIERCLASISQYDLVSVVVDNHSRDITIDRAAAGGAAVIRNDRNIGFGAAANQGVDHLVHILPSCNVVLFLNPDAYIEGNISSVYFSMMEDRSISVMGLIVKNSDGRIEQDSFGYPVTPVSLVTRRLMRSSRRVVCRPMNVGWVSGAAMFVNLAVFRSVKGFDPSFFLYWEDVDLCQRIRDAGFRVLLHPASFVVHERGASASDKRSRAIFYDRSADLYFYKHGLFLTWAMNRCLRRLYRIFVPYSR